MLYIVSTPIGNLQDVSLRHAQAIADSEYILAEDTRSARVLIDFIKASFDIDFPEKQHIISYYKDIEFEKLPEVMDIVRSDSTVSLISEAGTPVISDPGFLLLRHVIREELPYTVIPGPSAVTTALLHSGMNPQKYMFLGFLPKKPSDIRKLFAHITAFKQQMPDLVVSFFESPHRIEKTLSLLEETMPQAQVAVCRELTKKFEEVVRGTPAELKSKSYKGEITVVLS